MARRSSPTHSETLGEVTHFIDRAFADVAADKITGLRNLGLERDVVPAGT